MSLTAFEPINIHYSFEHQGTKINKTVSYYIGLCENKKTEVTQPEEIIETRWYSFSEAISVVTHANTKEVLNQTESLLIN